MRLIVTRPEPDASRTAHALMRLGHEAILSPMLDIEPVAGVKLPERAFQAVLVTSSNAVRALSGLPGKAISRDAPILTVGDHTALEAKRAGFQAARSAGGTLEDLISLAETELDPARGPLLYLAGEARTGNLAARLAEIGFDIETAVLYRAEPRTKLAGVAEDALRSGSADGVLLFSRRSADAFVAAANKANLAPLPEHIICFCLSAWIAGALPAVARGPVLIAVRPDQISLFALIEDETRRRRAAAT